MVRAPLALTLAIAVATAPACAVQHRITVRGADLRATIGERHRLGKQALTGTHWRDDRAVSKLRVTVVDGQWLLLDGGRVSLRELELGCAETPPAVAALDQGCPLAQFAEADFELRRYDTHVVRLSTDVKATLVVSPFLAAGGCALMCPDDSTIQDVSVGTVATIGVLLGAALTWAIIDCFFISGLGSKGCRD